jgi:RNA recognition motif-containing protein
VLSLFYRSRLLKGDANSVGNVPYNMKEDTLIDVFKKVGTVVGFRYVISKIFKHSPHRDYPHHTGAS